MAKEEDSMQDGKGGEPGQAGGLHGGAHLQQGRGKEAHEQSV